jgi:hypothetical protein
MPKPFSALLSKKAAKTDCSLSLSQLSRDELDGLLDTDNPELPLLATSQLSREALDDDLDKLDDDDALLSKLDCNVILLSLLLLNYKYHYILIYNYLVCIFNGMLKQS